MGCFQYLKVKKVGRKVPKIRAANGCKHVILHQTMGCGASTAENGAEKPARRGSGEYAEALAASDKKEMSKAEFERKIGMHGFDKAVVRKPYHHRLRLLCSPMSGRRMIPVRFPRTSGRTYLLVWMQTAVTQPTNTDVSLSCLE